jgi:S1-C subfamily serine protease
VNGKVIGMVFSQLNGTQNIGYIIPSEEIEIFIKAVSNGSYEGKPSLFGEYQMLGNSTLRSYLKLDKSVGGIIVRKAESDDSSYPIKKWDVITKIGDAPIDNSGTVELNDNVRVFFKYMVQKFAKDGKIPMTIMRDGKEIKINAPILSHSLAIPEMNGNYPSFFIYGPLVFTPATMEFITQATSGQRGANYMQMLSAAGSSLVSRMGSEARYNGEQVVVVPCPLFPNQVANGYGNPAFSVVKSVNGIPVKNLEHLVQILRDSKDEFISFEFDLRNSQAIILRRKDVSAATEEILMDNDIRSQGSADMLSIWNNK